MNAAILVREARHRAGLSQRQLAERAGTSQSAIARYERGTTTPSIASLSRIVEACGMDMAVQLVPRLDDLDTLIDLMLAMSVEDRLRTAGNYARLAAGLRRG